MLMRMVLLLASASLFLNGRALAASYADTVIAYTPGVGYATDFGTGAGLTNAASALGEPSRSTPGTFGGPVDPFNPPYLATQIVSIGTGGSLTVSLSSPIERDSRHPFGLDFDIYGDSGFVITNGNYSGGGVTDGTLFGATTGTTRVSVSEDNKTYYLLDPSRAPVVDTGFPTDGSGTFDLPVNPGLTGAAFASADLAQIRMLYAGSAGGAGYSLSWAEDANGQSVNLPEARFIRVDVLSDHVEIDGFASIASVPEPQPWVLVGAGALVVVVVQSTAGRLKAGKSAARFV
jgi:hypothetical protein